MLQPLASESILNGGKIEPLIIPSYLTNGTGLMNPSVFIHNDKIMVIVRHVNYTFYHSESKLFLHPWGPLTYVHPEHDLHLRTTNYYAELSNELKISRINMINTKLYDTYEPKWDFVGLEDARITCWNSRIYITGVRRDTTPNGEGRMELSELLIDDEEVKEIFRYRIPTPMNKPTYCEKNWMPVNDLPFHYVKWTNPTELVRVDINSNICSTIKIGNYIPISRDIRGGSQVISYRDGYLACTHEVDLFKNEVGRKDARYYHRFVYWDKEFNLIRVSNEFSFMDAHVEFCIGMAKYQDEYLLTFGFQDNAAFILSTEESLIEKYLHN